MPIIDSLPPIFENSSLENFIGTQKTKEICKKWAENYKQAGSVLITGDVGRGKTHLAIAMAKIIPNTKFETPKRKLIYSGGIMGWMEVNEESAKVIFQDIPMLMMEILKNYNDKSGGKSALKTMEYLMDESYNLIIADEIGVCNMTEHTRQIMFVLINYWYSNNVPVIFTTNIPGENLKDLDARMASRIMGMSKLKINLTGPDRRIVSQ